MGDAYRFSLKRGYVWMMEKSVFHYSCPYLKQEEIKRVSLASFGVRSLKKLQEFLLSQKVDYSIGTNWDNHEQCIWVNLSPFACAVIQFIEVK